MDFAEEYHKWYYDTKVWTTTTWLGVPCQKSVKDLWSYQEIITELRPSLVVEFGVFSGRVGPVLRHRPGEHRLRGGSGSRMGRRPD